MADSSDDDSASGGGEGYSSEDESACSTPFVSAPSSPARDTDTSCCAAFVSLPSFRRPARDPSFSAAFVSVPSFRDPSFSAAFVSVPSFRAAARDPSFSAAAAGGFYSAPASPARVGGPGKLTADKLGLDLDFDFSRCPPPDAAAMTSADELFDNGQIRPMRRLGSFLLRPHGFPPLDGDVPPSPRAAAWADDERGRVRSRSSRRRYRSLSPFRGRWLSPAPAARSIEPAAAAAASRSSSSSSTASSSSWSRGYHRRWRFLKGILQRSKSSGGGERQPPPASPKRDPSPSPGRGRARRSAYARLYEPRRAEAAEEMRRRTFLPYRPGLPLLGCLGLGSRGYVAMYGLVAAGKPRP